MRTVDIVVTATTASEPVFDGDEIEAGTHVTAMCQCHQQRREVDAGTVAQATFVPDLWGRLEQDVGGYLRAIEGGAVDADHAHAELGAVVAGEAPGRTDETELTLLDSGGTAVETVAAAELLFDRAREAALGEKVEMSPASETALTGGRRPIDMTRVCLVGEQDLQLSYELLSRETAREALAAYELREPYHNTVAVETVSLGAAVSLLNDLNWYLVRFVRAAIVQESSVSKSEWLSRDLATAVRDGELDPDETGRLLRVYGLESPASDGAERDPPQLVEPMFVARTGGGLPEYDLRDVEETLLVRVTEAEFEH